MAAMVNTFRRTAAVDGAWLRVVNAIRHAVLSQFRGRSRVWKIAFVLSSIILILRFYLEQPTCDLMFYRVELVKNYAVFWLCCLILIGLTRRGKVIFGIVILFALGSEGLVHKRIPTNEYRAVRRLHEMQTTLKSGNKPFRTLTDIINPALISGGQMSGYVFQFTPQFSVGGALDHYVVQARPFCYCATGQRSFTLEDSGVIHYTSADRGATANDPVLKSD